MKGGQLRIAGRERYRDRSKGDVRFLLTEIYQHYKFKFTDLHNNAAERDWKKTHHVQTKTKSNTVKSLFRSQPESSSLYLLGLHDAM